MTEFSSITQYVRRNVFLGGRPRLYRNGAVPQRSPILRFPSICAYTLWCKTTEFDVVTYVTYVIYVATGLVFRSHPRLHPNRRRPGIPPMFEVPFYLHVHRLSQNYQIWRGNTRGGGRVSWGQPRFPSGVPGLPVWEFSCIYTHIL